MESKRTHEELKEILDRNTAWIENCDSKTSIILGSFGVIAGIFLATDYVSKFKGILCHMTSNVFFWTIIYIIFCIFAISLILAGCVCWITVLFARVNPNEFSNRGIKTMILMVFAHMSPQRLGRWFESSRAHQVRPRSGCCGALLSAWEPSPATDSRYGDPCGI